MSPCVPRVQFPHPLYSCVLDFFEIDILDFSKILARILVPVGHRLLFVLNKNDPEHGFCRHAFVHENCLVRRSSSNEPNWLLCLSGHFLVCCDASPQFNSREPMIYSVKQLPIRRKYIPNFSKILARILVPAGRSP